MSKVKRIAWRWGSLAFLLGIGFGVFQGDGPLAWSQAGPPQAEYGDAPDGTSALYPGPLFSVTGSFPTLFDATGRGTTRVPGRTGAHHLDASQEWLGPFLAGLPAGSPSLERDANDPVDPDVLPNLVDGDGGEGGLLLTVPLLSIPPPATLTFAVTVAAGAPDLDRLINVLIDLNLDGRWGGTGRGGEPEWAVKNLKVRVPPGTTQVITTPPFAFASGNVLPFPSWLRLTLTRAPIDPAPFGNEGWDGSAPPGGFPFGETEDYYLPPAGTVFGGGGGGGGGPFPGKAKPNLLINCPGRVTFPPGGSRDFTCSLRNLGGPIRPPGAALGAAILPCRGAGLALSGEGQVFFNIAGRPDVIITSSIFGINPGRDVAINTSCWPLGPPGGVARPANFTAWDNDPEVDRDPATVTLAPADPPFGVITEPVPVFVAFEEFEGSEPQAEFTFAPEQPLPGEEIAFDASDSFDPDGELVDFLWDFGDGTTVGQGARVTHVYFEPGSYPVTLTVTDNDGLSASLTRTVVVRGGEEPLAAFTFAPEQPFPGDEVRFDASESFDPDGELVDFLWDFGDGTTDRGPQVVHRYPEPGPYVVTLTVTDNDDRTASASQTVFVQGEPLSRPAQTAPAQAELELPELPEPQVQVEQAPPARLRADAPLSLAVGEARSLAVTLELGETGLRLVGAAVTATSDEPGVVAVDPPEALADAEGVVTFVLTGVQSGRATVALESGDLKLEVPVTVGGAQSLVAAVAGHAGDPAVIDDEDILWAIELWVKGEAVPGLGAPIDDEAILNLIQLWISGQPI